MNPINPMHRQLFAAILCFFLLPVSSIFAVTAVDVNLDPLNTAGGSPDFAAEYTESGTPARIAAPEASVKEPAGAGITRLTVTITPPAPGDLLTADTFGTAILSHFENGVLTLAGPDSAAAFQNVLRTVAFSSDSRNPSETPRTIRVEALPEAEPVFTEMTVIAINDPPVQEMPGPQITPRDVPLVFSRGRGNAITIGDIDAGEFPVRTALSVPMGVLIPGDTTDVTVETEQISAYRLILTGAVPRINDALEGLRFEPPNGWFGQLSLLAETNDQGHTGRPGPMSVRNTVGIAVAVLGDNAPPEAHAGEDQSAYEYTAVSLDGTRSSDPDGTIVAYEWRQVSGPTVTLSDPAEALPYFTAPPTTAAGDPLTFQLTVTDNQGARGADFTTVMVEALPDATLEVVEGETAVLSFPDSGGNLSDYRWTRLAGPETPLSDAFSESPSLVGPIVGPSGAVLVFEATALDGDGEMIRSVVPVAVMDNGITGFPPEVLTFRTVWSVPMGIQVISGGLVALHPLDPDEVADAKNRPTDLPYGLIHMAIKTAMPGDSVVARLYLPAPAGAAYRWFKYMPGSEWRDVGNYAVFSSDRSWLAFKLEDGGTWDDDGAADGMILDPSGLGKPALPPPPDNGQGGSGDSGSSCFLDSLLSR